MKKFLSEFKEFAVKGNMIDLAVGMIIGTAFNDIVKSLVGDIIMPAVGSILGSYDFTRLVTKIGSVTIKTGSFVQFVINFIITALCLFIVVKCINRFKRKKQAVEEAKAEESPAKPDDVILLEEIRDALVEMKKSQNKE